MVPLDTILVFTADGCPHCRALCEDFDRRGVVYREINLSREPDEMARLRDEGPTAEELTKARELSKGRLLLRMEDTRAVSAWLGGQQLLLGKVNSIDDAIAEMEAVTLEDVQRVARELLVGERLHMAMVGPYRSDKRFARLLRL